MGDSKLGAALIVAAVFLCLGAALVVPRLMGAPDSRREAEVYAAVKVVNHALWKYAQEHKSEYPPTEEVLGGGEDSDVLLKEGYLVRYPPNPFREKRAAVRNAAGRDFSAGDFVYERQADSKYKYTLFGWGAAQGREVRMAEGEEH